eukprot:15362985-Ditylum_brightwellii.AAC.1
MKITEYIGEDISRVMGFIHGVYTILDNCDFLPPDFMQIMHNFLTTATDDEFVKHVRTIKTSQNLELLPDMNIGSCLENIEKMYNSKLKSNKWAKAVDKGQASIFVSHTGEYERRDCWNCSKKGSTAHSHIAPDCPHKKGYGQGGCDGRERGRGNGGRGRERGQGQCGRNKKGRGDGARSSQN